MSTNDDAISVALRAALVSPQEISDELALKTLFEGVERLLFLSASLASPAGIVHHALNLIAAEAEWEAYDDTDLEAVWRQVVEQSTVHFRNEPEGWVDSASLQFREACADTFGVEASLVPNLVRRFHSLSDEERYGVLRMIERSSAFGYARRGFEADLQTAQVADPDGSFRRLIRLTVGGH